MTPKQILRHKKKSLTKWRGMAKDLGLEQPKLKPKLDCKDCGYCRIRLKPAKYGSRLYPNSECHGCVLDKPMLCHRGGGAAFRNTDGYYSGRHPEISKEAAQLSVALMVAVIERDVERIETKLKT